MAFSRRANPVFGDDYAALRQVLIEARKAAGITQRGLARKIGRSNTHVSLIEAGNRRIDALELYFMAKAMDLPPEQIFQRLSAALEQVAAAEDNNDQSRRLADRAEFEHVH
jgi:transcriptional regulator with XRE-family HTH domain